MNNFIFAAAGLVSTLVGSGAAQAQVAAYAIDPTHTFVTFEASHFGTSTVRGRFDKKEGTLQFDRAGQAGQIEMNIDMASISTGVAALDQHLQSKDFFNTTEHPQARFAAERFSFTGDKLISIAGTLSLLGKTGPVTLTSSRFNCYTNPLFKREVCGGDFVANIKRSQWGMGYGLDFGLPDDIRLLIQVEAIKQ